MLRPILILVSAFVIQFIHGQDYTIYHQQVLKAQHFITEGRIDEALEIYQGLFQEYTFVFRNEYQVAAQLAHFLERDELTFDFLERGILAGWTWKGIRKNDFFDDMHEDERWKTLQSQYDSLYLVHLNSLKSEIVEEMQAMFKSDQRMAMKGLFTFSSKAQDRYATKRYSPKSEKWMTRISEITEDYGLPGERLVGKSIWLSVLISHHNSISADYNRQDRQYPEIRQKLLRAIREGELSPYDFAVIDEWYEMVKSEWTAVGYGLIKRPNFESLEEIDSNRAEIGIRSIRLTNALVDIENETGMDFSLDQYSWHKGKIDLE